MKRFMALLLVLCFLLLSACSGVEQGENSVEVSESKEVSESLTAESSESSELSEESSTLSEEFPQSSEEAVDVFCGGRFDGKESVKLVALGDSIARGYGLKNPGVSAFPAMLSRSVKSALGGTEVDYVNLAVDGMKTDGLLKLLENNPSALDGADIVVLCIGANNILGPFTTALVNANGGVLDNYDGNTEELEVFVDRLNALLKSEKFVSEMTAGIEKTREELPQVLKTIKNHAPDALLAVMTVYSPYHGIVMSIPYLDKSVNMGEASDKWVSLLNAEIKTAVENENCILVETYDAFATEGGLVNVQVSIMPPKFSFDPHPNAAGHKRLAELYMSVLSEQ